MLINQNFSVPAGDSLDVPFDLDPATVATIDFATLWWAAYEQSYGSPVAGLPAVIQKDNSVVGGLVVPGSPPLRFIVELHPIDTLSLLRNYYHEAKYLDASGNHVTVACGIMTVTGTEIRSDT